MFVIKKHVTSFFIYSFCHDCKYQTVGLRFAEYFRIWNESEMYELYENIVIFSQKTFTRRLKKKNLVYRTYFSINIVAVNMLNYKVLKILNDICYML